MTTKGRILLVEDETNLRELVKARLEQNGYEVLTAADGYEALARVRDDHPDLLILDLMIPKMDGYTVCRMLRFSRSEPLPIIMFTARSSPDDIRRGLDAGADAYVVKPFEPSALLGKVEELIAARRAEQEKQA
ncbi:MAG: response regulator, partial [candidate division WOR-3 bacterium]